MICTHLNVRNNLVGPTNVAKARSVSAKCNVSDNNDTNNVDIEQIVGDNDPFHCITPSVTEALFNAEMPLQEDHFQHIVNRCSYFTSSLLSSSHLSIENHCNQLNVFAGHNPLVSIN